MGVSETQGSISFNFHSDNVAPVAPEILRALASANHGSVAPYGKDEWSALLQRKFSDMFETDVLVFPVSTGTAANALSLASIARPWGGIYCHELAHIHKTEGGATEAFTGGAKLITLAGHDCKLELTALAEALRRAERGARYAPQPDAVSITQATEYGTVYTLDEIAAIGESARDAGIQFHVDGARFANSLVTLGCTPAEATWRRGVDILSLGATKNGAMTTDAIVVFNRALAEPLSYRLRRAGQTWSKMRFAAAQLIAYTEDNLYLRLAAAANSRARRLGEGLARLPGVHLVSPVQANLVFASMPEQVVESLIATRARFDRRPGNIIRLVTHFDSTDAEVDQFIELVRRQCLSR
ncbi:threonine aldolase family protein [Bradyrhizobium sp. BWA-3-5]|uniref:threonine aldolase family protein n=1 Tax=Bradyrhizobium sp. BWA-3-5 TaxID=3080013 RepID=UPI00293E12EC|nr:beta-eliminating lyase-related protein [Bradyrhizobium sp. BWA-3-5]WOH63961.1 beta-eliminating lyase-related protein [Bradyrhizobium sp. BWA-3-5]